MTPLKPEQGGLVSDAPAPSSEWTPSADAPPAEVNLDSPVFQDEATGKWHYREDDGTVSGAYDSKIGACEGYRVTRPAPWPSEMEPDPDHVELDPEGAQHRLDHAAQDVITAALTLIRRSKSDVFVVPADIRYLREKVKVFDLAYAEVVTIGKLMALAEDGEPAPALGDNVVDATYTDEERALADAAECLGEEIPA